jgi:hypothetical protein
VKGTTYSGIIYFPEHPDADMHGLLRIAVQCKAWIEIPAKLERYGHDMPILVLRNLGIWQESKSVAEQQATATRYGELLACPLVLQYLKAENYKPIPKSLLRRKQA